MTLASGKGLHCETFRIPEIIVMESESGSKVAVFYVLFGSYKKKM